MKIVRILISLAAMVCSLLALRGAGTEFLGYCRSARAISRNPISTTGTVTALYKQIPVLSNNLGEVYYTRHFYTVDFDGNSAPINFENEQQTIGQTIVVTYSGDDPQIIELGSFKTFSQVMLGTSNRRWSVINVYLWGSILGLSCFFLLYTLKQLKDIQRKRTDGNECEARTGGRA